MTIKDQNHYVAEEQKPKWIETKGNYKYQIFEDHVRILFEDKEIPISFLSLRHILENVDFSIDTGYYTGQCLDCHKFDALVKGYCKTCTDKKENET